MAKASFRWTGTKELRRTLRRMSAATPSMVARALYQEAEGIMAMSIPLAPVDRGDIRGSGHVQMPKVRMGSVEVVFGYNAPHALYMHEGTGPAVGRPPFFPPVSVISEWTRRVLGDESLGFVVARSIGEKGLKPRKFLEEPMRKRTHGMGRRIARAVEADLARLSPKGR